MKHIFCIALLLGISIAADASPKLIVGSKRFPESEILGEMITQIANSSTKSAAEHKLGLGNTGIVFNALKAGSIDIYPEYTGTISQELLKASGPIGMDEMNGRLNQMKLSVGVPFGFNDGYGLAMRRSRARLLGITTIQDLAHHPELKLGLSQEFLKRADGWEGLKRVYNLPYDSPMGFDHGAAYIAIAGGQTDIVDVYTTDAEIQKYDLVVLKDSRSYFPGYEAVLLYRSDVPKRSPAIWSAISRLRGMIDDKTMIGLNAKAAIDHQSPDIIAQNFLSERLNIGKSALVTKRPSILSLTFGGDFLTLTEQHIALVITSLVLSIFVGIPLGILAAHRPSTAGAILGSVGLIQTVPSIALLVFFVPVLSLGAKPTIAALFLYALLPIVRNTYTGLTDIAPSLRESSEALGLPASARLTLIELPLASRAILGGIKTSAIINVGTATIAAFIGAGGYGERIYSGLATYDTPTLLSGAIPAALLALLVQLSFDALDYALVPAGLRRRRLVN